MTENSFTPITEGSDVSAYENTDLSALNPESEEVNPSTEKLRNILEKTILIARYVTWFGLACMLVLAFYGWTRNQMQNSWLMGLKMNTNDSIWCQWMSHGHNDTLRKDAAFRSFLISRGKQSYIDLLESNHCIAPDTIAQWLELEKDFATIELRRAYETIVPKKFLSHTLDTLPELEVISKNAPEHRIHHEVVVKIMSETAAKMTDATSKISCHEITFDGLDATMRCQVSTRPPLQPRKRSLDFMAELEKTQSILVTYPESLDMKLDEKSGFLTTEFSLQVTYIPSRYEPERIKQLTYDKQ